MNRTNNMSDATTADQLAAEIVANIECRRNNNQGMIATLATDEHWYCNRYTLPWAGYNQPDTIHYDSNIDDKAIGDALKKLDYKFIMGSDQCCFGYVCPIDMEDMPEIYPWTTSEVRVID